MELTWWWLGVLVALAAAVVAWLRLRRRGVPRVDADGLLAANTERLKATPRYQQLVHSYVRWLTVQVACLALATLGAILLVSRLSLVSIDRPDQRNRDIVLCLDVSGSMMEADAKIVESYLQTVEQMKGERIGLVVWDSTPVTVFPLTNDYDFVKRQLETLKKGLEEMDSSVYAGTMEGKGSSLIGDGLASCVQRSDRLDEERARTIVLATDNQVNGDFIYSLPEATDLAIEKKIMVFGIYPNDYSDSDEAREVRDQCTRTKGALLKLSQREATASTIGDAIRRQEAKAFQGQPVRLTNDLPLPAALLVGLGLLGAVGAGWRARR